MQKSQRNTQKHLLFSTEYNISSYIKHTTYKNENIQLTVADVEQIFSARTTSISCRFRGKLFSPYLCKSSFKNTKIFDFRTTFIQLNRFMEFLGENISLLENTLHTKCIKLLKIYAFLTFTIISSLNFANFSTSPAQRFIFISKSKQDVL